MHIGPWWIPPFTARMAIAVIAALAWVAWRAPAYGLARRQMLGCVWSVALGALVAGRIGYVALHGDYFAQRPADIWALRRIGGMHGGAALVGGALAAGLWAWLARARWRAVMALLAPAALCVTVGGWWSCWMWGCAWGRETHNAPVLLGWLAVEAPNLYHEVVSRYAVQLLGGGWAAILALISAGWPRRAPWVLACYPLGAAGLTLLRGDPVPVVWGVRADCALNVILAAGLGAIAWRTRHQRLQDNDRGEI